MPTWFRKNRDTEDDSSGSIPVFQRRIKTRYAIMIPLLLVLLLVFLSYGTNLIPSRSMEPTLLPGDHAVIMRAWIAYPFGRMPARGDIITFYPPKSAQLDADNGNGNDNTASAADATDQQATSILTLPRRPKKEILIKRVIALPGETVQIIRGVVHVNGKPLHEGYHVVPPDPLDGNSYPYADDEPLTVPPGHLFVLGDNRTNGDDGRFWGTLDRKDVVGKYVFVLFQEKEIASEVDAAETASGR